MPRTYFPTPSSPKHKKDWEDQMNYISPSSSKSLTSSINDNVALKQIPSIHDKVRKFDRWERYDMKVSSPTSVADEIEMNAPPTIPSNSTPKLNKPSEDCEPFASKTKRTPYKRIIPGVSNMNMRQILAVVFSAYWDRADLYLDVLGLENDQPSDKELRLAFFRQGREVLATPIESPDDATMLTYGRAPFLSDSGGGSTISVVQSGVPVSRKAKLKFQAIGLAYDLLSDPTKRSLYENWRLWNPRVPKPTEQVTSRRAAADTKIRRQAAINSSSRFVTHDSQNRFMDSIKEDDQDYSETEREPHTGEYRPRFASSRLSSKYSANSAPSILRKSSAAFADNKMKKRISHLSTNRKISWNEEVEELTLMEDTEEVNISLHDSFGGGIKNTSIQDPYGESPEDWFGSINSGWFESDPTSMTQENIPTTDQKPNLKEKPFPHRFESNGLKDTNIHSLGGNVFIGSTNHEFDVPCEYDDKPDDSFLVIMGGPPKMKKKHQNKIEIKSDFESHSSEAFRKEKTRNKLDSKRGITVTMQNSPFNAGTPERKFAYSNKVNNYGAAHTLKLPVTNIPVHQGEEDTSLLTNDFTNSWYGNPSSEDDVTEQDNDDDVDYEYDDNLEEADCNGIGHTVDLARGFQASLSKYITAAVKDMKEGLAIVGKNWDELDKPDAPRKENKNFFTLEAFEIDAMMGILKSEMNRFNDRFAGCGAPDDEIEYSESNLKPMPNASSKYKSTNQYGRATTMFKSPPESKPKRGIRKRLSSLFSRKSK